MRQHAQDVEHFWVIDKITMIIKILELLQMA